jgi:hypothetical protein
MSQYDEKELAALIKVASKTRLIWKKSSHREMVTNGHWIVLTDAIPELKVRVALYAAFGQELKEGVLTLNDGEIISRALEVNDFFLPNRDEAEDVGTITAITLHATADIPSTVRIIHFGTELVAIQEDYIPLVETKTAYRNADNPKSPIFLGDELEVAVGPVPGPDWRQHILKLSQFA